VSLQAHFAVPGRGVLCGYFPKFFKPIGYRGLDKFHPVLPVAEFQGVLPDGSASEKSRSACLAGDFHLSTELLVIHSSAEDNPGGFGSLVKLLAKLQ
jgi:hypothetical protein